MLNTLFLIAVIAILFFGIDEFIETFWSTLKGFAWGAILLIVIILWLLT
jgi:hypothetical protein